VSNCGETHFRTVATTFVSRDFAPPSPPIGASPEMKSTTTFVLRAPPGWDTMFHATPRKQLAVMLDGEASLMVSDGEVRQLRPGDTLLLNDAKSKGHLTQVRGPADAHFLMVGLEYRRGPGSIMLRRGGVIWRTRGPKYREGKDRYRIAVSSQTADRGYPGCARALGPQSSPASGGTRPFSTA
jgi:hypothetical protein